MQRSVSELAWQRDVSRIRKETRMDRLDAVWRSKKDQARNEKKVVTRMVRDGSPYNGEKSYRCRIGSLRYERSYPWKLQIVKRQQRAFKITGLTWIVERSFAWLGRNRAIKQRLRVQRAEL
jgi:hypothetical protein